MIITKNLLTTKKLPRSQYGRYENIQDFNMTSFFRLLKAFEMTPQQFFENGFEKYDYLGKNESE